MLVKRVNISRVPFRWDHGNGLTQKVGYSCCKQVQPTLDLRIANSNRLTVPWLQVLRITSLVTPCGATKEVSVVNEVNLIPVLSASSLKDALALGLMVGPNVE
jgi:hypothetical protein